MNLQNSTERDPIFRKIVVALDKVQKKEGGKFQPIVTDIRALIEDCTTGMESFRVIVGLSDRELKAQDRIDFMRLFRKSIPND